VYKRQSISFRMGSAVSAATLPDHAASRGDAERLAGHAGCGVQ